MTITKKLRADYISGRLDTIHFRIPVLSTPRTYQPTDQDAQNNDVDQLFYVDMKLVP